MKLKLVTLSERGPSLRGRPIKGDEKNLILTFVSKRYFWIDRSYRRNVALTANVLSHNPLGLKG